MLIGDTDGTHRACTPRMARLVMGWVLALEVNLKCAALLLGPTYNTLRSPLSSPSPRTRTSRVRSPPRSSTPYCYEK